MGAGAWTASRPWAEHRRCPSAQRSGSLCSRGRRTGRRRVHDPPGADERSHPGARCARRAGRLGDPRLRPRRRRRVVAAAREPVRDPDGAGRDGLVPVDALLGKPRGSVHDRHRVRPRSRRGVPARRPRVPERASGAAVRTRPCRRRVCDGVRRPSARHDARRLRPRQPVRARVAGQRKPSARERPARRHQRAVPDGRRPPRVPTPRRRAGRCAAHSRSSSTRSRSRSS